MELNLNACDFCKLLFGGDVRASILHYQEHISQLEKRLCPECLKVFCSKFSLQRHFESTHMELERIPCCHCPKTFKNLR